MLRNSFLRSVLPLGLMALPVAALADTPAQIGETGAKASSTGGPVETVPFVIREGTVDRPVSSPVEVPEPSALLLFGAASAFVLARRRKQAA